MKAGGIAAFKGRLANFKQPKWVMFLDELPRNTMGKVKQAEMRKGYVSFFTVKT